MPESVIGLICTITSEVVLSLISGSAPQATWLQLFTVLEILSDAEILMDLFASVLLCRWPSLLKYYSHTDGVSWLEEYKARHNAGLEAQRIVASFSKRFFSEHVSHPCACAVA